MVTDAARGPAPPRKRLGGRALLVLGCLGAALGAVWDSPGLAVLGVAALALGLITLVVKIRPPDTGT